MKFIVLKSLLIILLIFLEKGISVHVSSKLLKFSENRTLKKKSHREKSKTKADPTLSERIGAFMTGVGLALAESTITDIGDCFKDFKDNKQEATMSNTVTSFSIQNSELTPPTKESVIANVKLAQSNYFTTFYAIVEKMKEFASKFTSIVKPEPLSSSKLRDKIITQLNLFIGYKSNSNNFESDVTNNRIPLQNDVTGRNRRKWTRISSYIALTVVLAEIDELKSTSRAAEIKYETPAKVTSDYNAIRAKMTELDTFRQQYSKAENFQSEYNSAHSFLGKIRTVWTKVKEYFQLGYKKLKDGMVCVLKKKFGNVASDTFGKVTTFLDGLANAATNLADILSTTIPGFNLIVMIVRILYTFKPLYDSSVLIINAFNAQTWQNKYKDIGKGVVGIILSILYIFTGIQLKVGFVSVAEGNYPVVTTKEEAESTELLPI